MIQLQLNRDYFLPYAILGRLVEPQSGRSWDTIERPWVPSSVYTYGVKGQSCIPLGEYRIARYSSDAHPGVFSLSNPTLGVYVQDSQVPAAVRGIARTNVLIHPANWASELRGCVAPGKKRAQGPDGYWMVQRSRDAFNELKNTLARSFDAVLVVTSGGAVSG
jgi:hypothetical protein